MGEQKRRAAAVRALIDQGKLIEAGFAALLQAQGGEPAPEKVAQMRLAFLAGAQHLFASMMLALDDQDEDATALDFRRMDRIAAELVAAEAELEAWRAARPEPASRDHAPDPREARRHFEALAPEHRLGDAPVEAQWHAVITQAVTALDRMFNGELRGADRPVGFVLLTFPYGERPGRANFASNGAARRDLIALFREMIWRFEGGPEGGGGTA